MDAFILMLKNVLIFVLLAVPGYLLVKCKVLKQEQSGVLSKLLSLVAMPFLIISGTVNLTLNKDTVLEILFVAILGTVLTFVFYFLSFFFVGKVSEDQEEIKQKKKNMIRFTEIFANNGFLGIPLASALFGASSKICSYLMILVIINNIFLYTLGTYMVSCDKKNMQIKKIFFNPVVIGFAVGVILNLTGVCKAVPEIIVYSDYLKNLVTPLAMLILGMKMGGIKLSSVFATKKLYLVSLAKLIVFPVVTIAIVYPLTILFSLDVTLFVLAMFMSFAMPTAGLATAFADSYNGDVEGAAIYTFGCTILSTVTIPILYLLLTVIF